MVHLSLGQEDPRDGTFAVARWAQSPEINVLPLLAEVSRLKRTCWRQEREEVRIQRSGTYLPKNYT